MARKDKILSEDQTIQGNRWQQDPSGKVQNTRQISLRQLGKLTEETEDSINKWYEESLSDLNTKNLREEQYKRKKAMLRVEYWTKMDKLKNNANPTVVNCT